MCYSFQKEYLLLSEISMKFKDLKLNTHRHTITMLQNRIYPMSELVCDFSTKSIKLQNLMLTVDNLFRLA